jgi:hypothetical protein
MGQHQLALMLAH